MAAYTCIKKCFHVDSTGKRRIYKPGDKLVDAMEPGPHFKEIMKPKEPKKAEAPAPAQDTLKAK